MKTSLDHLDLPCSVSGAEFLLQDSLQRKEVWLGVIDELRDPIRTFLERLNHPSEEEMGTAMTKDYNSMIASLNGLLEELDSETGLANAFWVLHKARLDHIIKVCQFRKSADKVQGEEWSMSMECGVWGGGGEHGVWGGEVDWMGEVGW